MYCHIEGLVDKFNVSEEIYEPPINNLIQALKLSVTTEYQKTFQMFVIHV